MDNLPISTHLGLTDFIRSAWMRNGGKHQNLMMNLFVALTCAGCDYYDLMNLYSEHDFTEPELEIFAEQSPLPKAIMPITPQNIKGNIFRWTASKYHTDLITRVVEDIHRKLLLGKPGMSVYNSNQNPRSKRSLNDRYILLMTASESLFLDINRKSTVKFQKE